jgi:hypothetical protein
MAIVQALLALIFRSAGKLLNMAFGWATVMLFGKVPQDRQKYLSVIAFGSVAWMVVVLGVIFPRVGAFLLALVPLPDWVEDHWVRLAMLVAAFVTPLIVGAVSLVMLEPERRPKDLVGKAKGVLKGYPYTLGVAITLIMMTVFAPIRKVRDLVRRWTSQHVAVIVEANDYLEVVGDLQQALARGGIETRREQASWMLRLPTKVLMFFAGGSIEKLVADQLTNLKADKVEVLLHPADMVISGRELDAAHARAIITEQLTFTKAYQTWNKEAQQLEDRLRAIWCELRASRDSADPATHARLQAIERDLRAQMLPFEEWDVLYREKLMVERALLQMEAGIVDRPADLTEAAPEELSAANPSAASAAHSRSGALPGGAPRPAAATVSRPQSKWRAAVSSVFAAVVGLALFLRHGSGRRDDSRRRMRQARAS